MAPPTRLFCSEKHHAFTATGAKGLKWLNVYLYPWRPIGAGRLREVPGWKTPGFKLIQVG